MKTNSKWFKGAAMVAASLMQISPAAASSHREAPAISVDPAADNTDLWAWVAPGTHDKLHIVAAYNPLEEPSGGPNFHKFSDDVMYVIHITRGDSLKDVVTYQINFKTTPIQRVDVANPTAPPGGGKEFFAQLSGQKQTYTITRIDREEWNKRTVIAKNVEVAPTNIGPRTSGLLGYPGGKYDDAFAATFIKPTSEGGRVWAGPRDDGFYVDLGGVFNLANLRAKGTAQDGVSGYNCHAIVLEIPTATLTEDGKAPGRFPSDQTTLGIWASASRRQVQILNRNGTNTAIGPWVQVSRLGLPLVNEAVIGLQDKDKFNRTRPKNDVENFGAYFLNPIVVRDAEAVGIYAALGVDPTPFKHNRTDILDVISLKNIPYLAAHSLTLNGIGDVLRLDMAVDSGFPNGRPLMGGREPNMEQSDVTNVLLSLLLTKDPGFGVSDGVDYNDKPYLSEMPWLALPWQGYDQGHGKPTP